MPNSVTTSLWILANKFVENDNNFVEHHIGVRHKGRHDRPDSIPTCDSLGHKVCQGSDTKVVKRAGLRQKDWQRYNEFAS